MRVLFFIDSLFFGGKERRLTELMKELKLIPGIDYELALMSDDIHYKEVFNLGINIHYIIRKTKKDLSVFCKFFRLCKEYRPDIVHTWDSMTAIYSVPACKFLKIKLVNGMVVDTPIKRNIFNKHWLRARITFPFSTAIVGNSKAGLEAYKTPKNKSISIYNGIDLSRFNFLKEPSMILEEIFGEKYTEISVLGMVAGVDDRKDYGTLISAAITLVSKNDNIRFILVGGGVDLIEMKSRVPDSLSGKIVFLGKRSDVESIINVFQVGILLTNTKVHGEGISNSIIEYMALGKPVIATKGGGTNEIVSDFHNGFLIESEDKKTLVERIETLINNRDLREEFGKRGKQTVIDMFDLKKMSMQYVNLYSKLLK